MPAFSKGYHLRKIGAKVERHAAWVVVLQTMAVKRILTQII
jgi:hypothetical protein